MNHVTPISAIPYTVFEGMTSISALLHAKEDGKNIRPIYEILFDQAYSKSKFRTMRYLEISSQKFGFTLKHTSSDEISSYANGQTHGGVVALCGDRPLPSLNEANIKSSGFYVMLEGIEDPFNFGMAVRSLYAAGVDGVILPPRNWMSAAGIVARSSAGTSELMDLYVSDASTSMDYFRAQNYQILCAGIRRSISIYDQVFTKPLYLVIGGEKRGISAAVLAKADQVVRIDYGRKFQGSLTTASSAGILAFEIMRQNKLSDLK